ncbi:hypothetical protein O7626_40140 [Micromonospora sp. WMMD1102]|uniref:hypothetical protein n=1 Tax=Micromonospora sp. WMMD1102 TaxID=3016105 RepID=UPI0024153756|nr:hypothetical protein [Micromonospora sp. WMMD1102]MDG4792028.1 hypothetical protein [Micromonospora sp. WMMD1102]
MAKTAQQLRDDMRTMVISRSTDELIRDYKVGSGLANAANDDVDQRAPWIVVLVAIETELNERGIETCELCGWPAGEHDPMLGWCSA